MMAVGSPFPFQVSPQGTLLSVTGADETLRAKIIQILFTAPGERVNQPDFGCGLFNLIFEPNDTILASALEFTIGQALTRWLRDEMAVNAVNVSSQEETVTVELAYTRKSDLSRQAVRVHFK